MAAVAVQAGFFRTQNEIFIPPQIKDRSLIFFQVIPFKLEYPRQLTSNWKTEKFTDTDGAILKCLK